MENKEIIIFRQLKEIDPSPATHTPLRYPCRIYLHDLSVIDPAYIYILSDGHDYVDLFRYRHQSFAGSGDIARVERSVYRLPAKIAKQIELQGESLPDCWIYDLAFNNGEILTYASSGNWDFPMLPAKYDIKNIYECRKAPRKKQIDIGDFPGIPCVVILKSSISL